MHIFADKKLLMLRPNDIISTGSTMRQFFDTDSLKLLSKSIASSGVINPLLVKRGPNGRYFLVSGERRLRAARLAGIRRIPCIVHNIDDETAKIYALSENIQHRDINIFEEARFLNSLIYEHGFSEAELSIRLGVTQSSISAKLKLLRLDIKTQKKIIEYGISEDKARLLLKLPESLRSPFADRIFYENLNTEGLEAKINEFLNPSFKKKTTEPVKKAEEENNLTPPKASIGDIRLFENSLYKLAQTLGYAGINSDLKTTETSRYLEYRIKIEKSTLQNEKYKQLKIC